jgi:hypothetical protein
MNWRNRFLRFVTCLVANAAILMFQGCMSPWDEFREHQRRAARHAEPYYGTGVVVSLSWKVQAWNEAIVDFSPYPAALYNVCLSSVRSDQETARLKVVTQTGKNTSKAIIISRNAMPAVGDAAFSADFGKMYGCTPYPWTGVVTQVIIPPEKWNKVKLDFRNHPLPRDDVLLLVIRGDRLVGKVEIAWENKTAWITEGAPQVGDLVVGIQNMPIYEKQRAIGTNFSR